MRLGAAFPACLAFVLSGVVSAAPGITVKTRGLASVEVDAGRDRGLVTGARLRVRLRGAGYAELEVLRADATSAACRVLGTPGTIRPGDAVLIVPPAPAQVAPPSAAAAPAKRPAPVFAAMKSDFALVVAPSPAATPAPAPTPAPASVDSRERARSYRVTYRSAASVYVEGGRAHGLAVGDGLRVADGAREVGRLEVVYAAEQSASCKVTSEKRPIRAGDVAVVVSRVARPAAESSPTMTVSGSLVSATPSAKPVSALPAATPAAGSSGGRRVSGPWARLRGTASLGYYRSWDGTESGLDFEQRTARLDLGLYDLGGLPLTFTLRARSRDDIRARTLSTRTPAHERTDRLYEASLRYDPVSEKVGLELGRLASYRLAGVGYLDGALVHVLLLPSVHLGAFGGRAAEVEGLGEGNGRKLGGFVRLSPAGRYKSGWYDATLAFVREDAEGDLSREYLSLESRFSRGSRFSLFQRAELDLNRGWRQELGGRTLQLSNVSLSTNLRATASTWAFLSYDGRRNYRYVRNRLVPEEVFDDLLHQGLRAGLSFARPGGFGATASAGMSLKEKDPRHPELNLANAYSVSAGVRHGALLGFSVGLDGSGFWNGYTDGALVSVRFGRYFAAGHMLDLSYGRSLYRVKESGEDRATQWIRLIGRADLPWRLFLLGDLEYDIGDDLSGPRGLFELGVLF